MFKESKHNGQGFLSLSLSAQEHEYMFGNQHLQLLYRSQRDMENSIWIIDSPCATFCVTKPNNVHQVSSFQNSTIHTSVYMITASISCQYGGNVQLQNKPR
ncbi:hypothetical protein ISCGN_015220 [Ixodes scapularis]